MTDTGSADPPDTPVPPPLFDDAHPLLVSVMGEARAYAPDASLVGAWPVADLVDNPLCDSGECRAEGISAYGDRLYLNWGLQNGFETQGGIAQVDAVDGTLVTTAEMRDWIYPHETVRDPHGPYLIVADAMLDALLWVPDDGTAHPNAAVAAIDSTTPGIGDAHTPNGLTLVEDGDDTWLVVSYRGNDPKIPASEVGRIVCFEVSDRDNPRFQWAFPPDGYLQAPHDPTFHWRDGRWVMLYAHSHGNAGRAGTVGVAQTVDLAEVPTYIADLAPLVDNWSFPRGVVLTGDDQLIVTDTGGDGSLGGVFLATFPADLRPSGVSGVTGAYHADGRAQHFEKIDEALFVGELWQPYRAILWDTPFDEEGG